MSTYDTIREAILKKQQVFATFKGFYREMCPHVIGTKDGKQQALFYQFGGESSSRPIQTTGSLGNWRCIPIDGLSDVKVRDGQWHTAPNHSRTQTCVDHIDVEVTP
jgi:hypothetical protein